MKSATVLQTDARMRRPALDALVAANVLDSASAQRAAQAAEASGQSAIAIVHQLALADDVRVLAALSAAFNIRTVSARDIPATPVALKGVSAAFLRREHVLPLGWRDGELLVGVIDPDRSDGLAALAFAAHCGAAPLLMAASDQNGAFDTLYGAAFDEPTAIEASSAFLADDAVRMRDHADAAPAVRLVDALFDKALELNASDIHIEPLPDRVRIRLRVDGALQILREEPAALAAPIAARIKILADLDVADRRRAQDGRTSLAAKGKPVDVRVSTIPSAYGETVALRLLRRETSLLNLPALGFDADTLSIFEHVLSLRRGLFLITGPTGSGKTTTLYAMIERLRQQSLKILSIEDPIEYFFSDITQTQVNEDAGLTFPTALRSFLRQDPDVILIGEIRDAETARIAVQAALTGHLVLATLHTSDAPGAIARLADMGVDRYLIAATLAGAIAQRLVRKLCPLCRQSREASPIERAWLEPLLPRGARPTPADPHGCAPCRQTGYQGRIAVAEGFLPTDPIRAAAADTDFALLSRAITASGFTPLANAAARRAAAGEISCAEVKALALS